MQNHAMIVFRGTGAGYADKNVYQATTTKPPTQDELERFQAALGFDKRGYGGPSNVKTVETVPGFYLTTWYSQASCD